MCTVTIIPKGKNNFILTSNRDESPDRVAIAPDFYSVKGVKMLFPKDEISGGTWIGVSGKDRLVCVLNGGFITHQRNVFYRKSRGTVAKDFMACLSIEEAVVFYNFDDIEPFTMVIVEWHLNLSFIELVWDGEKAHFKKLPLEPRIWSSATLYSESMKLERTAWFEAFTKKNKLNGESLLQFHKTAGSGNLDYGVIMNRGFVKTTSITQVDKSSDSLNMYHENLQNNTNANKQFNPTKL